MYSSSGSASLVVLLAVLMTAVILIAVVRGSCLAYGKSRQTAIALVGAVLAVLAMFLYINHTKPVSFQNVRIRRMDEALRAIVQKYDLAKIVVRYHRAHRLDLSVYIKDNICRDTERAIFLECLNAVLPKEKYQYPINGVLHEQEREGYETYFPSFDFAIGFSKGNRGDREVVTVYYIGQTSDGMKKWYYREGPASLGKGSIPLELPE